MAAPDAAVDLIAYEPRWLDDLVAMWRASFEPSWQLDDVKLQWTAAADVGARQGDPHD